MFRQHLVVVMNEHGISTYCHSNILNKKGFPHLGWVWVRNTIPQHLHPNVVKHKHGFPHLFGHRQVISKSDAWMLIASINHIPCLNLSKVQYHKAVPKL